MFSSTRIIGKVFAILGLLALAVFGGLYHAIDVYDRGEEELRALIDKDAVGIIWMARARASSANAARLTFEVMVEPSSFRARQAMPKIKDQQAAFLDRFGRAEAGFSNFNSELVAVRAAFQKTVDRATVMLTEKLAQPDGPPSELVRDLGRSVAVAADELDDMMVGLMDRAQAHAQNHSAAVGAQIEANGRSAVAIIAGIVGITFVFTFFTLRGSVAGPLQELVATAQRILSGQRDAEVTGCDRKDEIGDVARVIQLLKDTMAAADNLGRQTVDQAEQMAAATNQAAAAVEQVSSGSQRQMMSVENITQSVTRTTAIIGTIASVSLSAKDRSREAANGIGSGMAKIKEMTDAVKEIAVTSARINRITQSIGELATRSNILSLNAAIEAARAGEHGRGFSVVAEEVGNLAQQTGALAQEIALLAADSGERIQNGVSLATGVGALMGDVAKAINETDSLSEDIARSMDEQGGVLRSIEQSLQRLREISNANASAAEEIAATMVELTRAAESTRAQAESLRSRSSKGA